MAAANIPALPGYTVELMPPMPSDDARQALKLLRSRGSYHGVAFGDSLYEKNLRRRLHSVGHPDPSLGRVIDLVARENATMNVVGVLHARTQPEPLEIARRQLPADMYPAGLERTINAMSMAVDPAHGGRGISSRLMQELEARARVAGFDYITGYAEGDESRLRRLYERLGFTCEPNGRNIPARFVGEAAYGLFQSNRDGFHFWKQLTP